MITNICGSSDFIPVPIWANYVKMNNRDVENFILYNNLLANVRELFVNSTYESNKKLN